MLGKAGGLNTANLVSGCEAAQDQCARGVQVGNSRQQVSGGTTLLLEQRLHLLVSVLGGLNRLQ